MIAAVQTALQHDALLCGAMLRVCNGAGADAFIIVLGAPVGSLCLTPAAIYGLRQLFYVLAVVNFAGYVWVEPAFWDARVWLGALAPLLVGEVLLLRWHHSMMRGRLEKAACSSAASSHASQHPLL